MSKSAFLGIYSQTEHYTDHEGPVLGPILFLVFVNDLPDVLSGSVLLLADDVKLISAR